MGRRTQFALPDLAPGHTGPVVLVCATTGDGHARSHHRFNKCGGGPGCGCVSRPGR